MSRIRRAVAVATIVATSAVLGCFATTDLQDAVDSVVISSGLGTIQVGQSVQITAVAKDVAGVSIEGIEIAWNSSAPGVATVSSTGLLTGVSPGTTIISASAQGQSAQVTVTVVPAGTTVLTMGTQPSASVASGTVFPQQPTVQLHNGTSNVAQAGVVVTAVIATGGGTLGGTPTATTNASGLATFTGLSITGTIGDHTLSFSAPGLTTVTSATIVLTVGPASQLAITTQPSPAPASGVAFAQQPVIQIRDVSGNAVSQSSAVVTAALASGSGTLGGTLTATTNASGTATFSNLMITGSGAHTVRFTATGLSNATSASIVVGATASFDPPDLASNDFEGNTFTPTAANGVWANETPGNSIIDDPTGGGRGKVFKNTFGPAADVGGIDNRADINHFVSYYPASPRSHGSTNFFRGYLFFPANTVNFTNTGTLRKLTYWRTGDGGTNQCDFVVGMFGTQMFVSIALPGTEIFDRDVVSLAAGQWHLIEVEQTMNSAPGVANGSVKIYVNGTQVYSRANVAWTRPSDPVTRGWTWFGVGHQREGNGTEGTITEERYWDKLAFSTKRIGP